MPDFGPYLIFRLYLSRMQKYAFFFRLSKHSRGKSFSRPPFFKKKLFGPRGVPAILQTKRGRKGKNALSWARYLQKKRS